MRCAGLGSQRFQILGYKCPFKQSALRARHQHADSRVTTIAVGRHASAGRWAAAHPEPSAAHAALSSATTSCSQGSSRQARDWRGQAQLQARRRLCGQAVANAAAGGAADDSRPVPQPSGHNKRRRGPRIGSLLEAASFQIQKFSGLSSRFMPMVSLFFLLAFVNTVLDSLKDTLVITAVGGGAQVIPYLTVYAVLPSSLIFLYLYSIACQRLSRSAMFKTIITVFMAWNLLFAFVLYPNHEALHPHELADRVALVLPSGLSGLVGMVRNWSYTLFYCMSELWGDVCLGLLFWGLANDTTSLSDAHTLYPLFGLGANVAQAVAGMALKVVSGRGTFVSQIQWLMVMATALSVAAAVLYGHVHKQDEEQKALDLRRRQQRTEARKRQQLEQLEQQQRYAAAYNDAGAGTLDSESTRPGPTGATAPHTVALSSSSAHNQLEADGASLTSATSPSPSRSSSLSSSLSESVSSSSAPSSSGGEADVKPSKPKPSIQEIFGTLARSVPIQCLAVMSLAQGLCSNLAEFAWKSHIKLLYPTPAEFTNFLGDVSTWQGVVTGGLMLLSPAMFARMGWKEVAAATPQVLLVGGAIFFSSCIAYQTWVSGNTLLAAGTTTMLLKALVYGGALLYVFSKSAKFSMHKPSEEMVYISLDEEGRTKGKAAIDVVGSQAGKSGGSILQQMLLIVSSGSISGSLPIMCGVYLLMANGWLRSVSRLSDYNPRYGHADSVHPTLSTVDFDSEDEEEEKQRDAEIERMLGAKKAMALSASGQAPGGTTSAAGDSGSVPNTQGVVIT